MNLMIMLIGMTLSEWQPESPNGDDWEADQAVGASPLLAEQLR